jgi:hypothetical protein
MTEKFDTDFEKILYAGLIDYAGKTLNSVEIAPLFKSKPPNERRAIKQEILKRLQQTVKKVSKELSEKSLDESYSIAMHQKEVKKIIDEIFRGTHEN